MTKIDPNAKTIWCMFSVENNYDQPAHNLVRWWTLKPTLEAVAHAIGHQFPAKDDEDTLKIVKVWQGDGGEQRFGETFYRLEEVPEGSAWKP